MDDTREKKVFVAKLKGEPLGEDSLGNELFVGDIIAYATTQDTSATLKFGKIIKLMEQERVHRNPNGQMMRKQFVKVQVRTVRRWTNNWQTGGLGVPNTNNAILMRDPPQEIIDLLEQFENEKGDKS